MKKIFTTLALTSAFGLAVNAQADLSISSLLPVNGFTYDNFAAGDTVFLFIEIKNLGTTAIVESDTLYLQVSGIIKGDAGGDYIVTWSGGGYSIAGGGTDTFAVATTQGYYWGAGTGGESVYTTVATNAEQTFNFTLVARDLDGNLVIESDFVPGTEEGTYNIGENNMIEVTAMYGEVDTTTPPSSIFAINDATNINVYPNPTKGTLNFAYDFDKASGVIANVYDVTGRLVVTKDFGTQNTGTQNFTLDVANLSNGNYTLEVSTNNNKGVSKFVISK